MKGVAYLGGGKVEVRDYSTPVAGPGEVLVRMRAAGLCGSDLHKYHQDTRWAAARSGMISGHEPAGVVCEVGAGVEGVSVGERVSVYHSLGCGRCRYCHEGTPVFCEHEGAFGRTRDGSHADYLSAPARYCMPLPDELSFSVGAMLACTAGTAYAALSKLDLSHGDRVVVFGLGPVGLSAFLMASAAGFRCTGVDVNPCRIEQAARCDAGEVINAAKSDVVASVLDATDGVGVRGVLECSGAAVARSQAVEILAVRGALVAVGVGEELMRFDPERVIRQELCIRGNAVYSTSDYFRLIDFLRTTGLDLDRIVTHRFPIGRAAEAFDLFDRGQTGKVVFEWHA